MARSTTSPLPRTHDPPSPDFASSNLDCAFPPFPTSRSGTPDSAHNKALEPKASSRNIYAEPDSFYAPMDPGPKKSPSVLQRMNTISPGPFTGRLKEDWQAPKPSVNVTASRHKRSATASSVRESLRSNNWEKRGHGRQASNSTLDWGYGSVPPTRNTEDRTQSPIESSSVNAKKPPPRPARPTENVDWFLHDLNQRESKLVGQQRSPGPRSKTFPLRKESEDDAGSALAPPARNSATPSHTRRPTLPSNPKAGATLPQLMSRSAPNVEQPKRPPSSGSVNRSRNWSVSRSGIAAKANARPLPPPPPNVLQPIRAPRGSHRRAESSSSSGSDGRRDGSKSTPPTSATSSMSSTASSTELFSKPSTVHPRPSTSHGKTGQSLRTKPSSEQFQSLNAFARPKASSTIKRPNAPRSMNLDKGPVEDGPESPLDPAIQQGMFRLPPTLEGSQAKRPIASAPATSKPLPPQPQPRADPPALQKRPTTKGSCRGCGGLIVGKSIKAADGRLSGRYHKQCKLSNSCTLARRLIQIDIGFVCQTCKSAFATTSFYVIDDHPYCEQHYHTLNNSLCHSCNRGIEGQYLETESQEKFHQNCFACAQCGIALSQDYFEVGTGVFCERHAFGQMPGPGAFLAPGMGMGRKNPERRTTRLMMM